MRGSQLFTWQRGELIATDEAPHQPRLIAADSWLVEDDLVLNLPGHRARFVDAAGVSRSRAELAAFWNAAVTRIPSQGAWFPRIELALVGGVPRLRFWLRPAPAPSVSARILTWKGADPRTFPLIKGPDLFELQKLRVFGQTSGADEVLLLSDDGHIVEGALSSVLWWRDGVLHHVSPKFPRIRSITEAAIVALARNLNVKVATEVADVATLAGSEIWTCSALHGIRVVSEWLDGPGVQIQPGRREEWQAALLASRAPIERTA